MDMAINYVSGYWNLIKQQKSLQDTTFIKGFAASNVFVKQLFWKCQRTGVVETGYQAKMITCKLWMVMATIMAKKNRIT